MYRTREKYSFLKGVRVVNDDARPFRFPRIGRVTYNVEEGLTTRVIILIIIVEMYNGYTRVYR